jgi:hypothetical protein
MSIELGSRENGSREQYEGKGFVVVPSGLSPETMEAIKGAGGPEQPEVYRYNKSGHRWFESWKVSQAVRDAVYAEPVVGMIRHLYDVEPRPFQTILFDRGSNQPLHEDAVHFDSHPRGRIVGVWLALEDMDLDNGPLCYVPGSQQKGFEGWQASGHPAVEVGAQEAEYRKYEAHLEKWYGPLKEPFVCKAGDAFVWGVDLLHGGWPVKDETRTRWSLVTHYFLPPLEYAFAPMFGTEEKPYRKSMRWFTKEGEVHTL